ncbi:unnamed protein product, partial [Mesorhabditis spiculigera]
MSETGHLARQEGLPLPENLSKTRCGEISQIPALSEDIGRLCLNEECSDVTLLIDGERIPAHKVILAARSSYFKALFYGGLRTDKEEVELKETAVTPFKYLLRFIYSSTLSLVGLGEDLVIEILAHARLFQFTSLVESLAEYLKLVLDDSNLCTIFNISQLYSIPSLSDFCLEYADRNAGMVLSSEGFLQLSRECVQQLISRDSFCAREIDIFRAIDSWCRANPEDLGRELLKYVRLSLISMDDLLSVLRPSSLVSDSDILDAIQKQRTKHSCRLMHRGMIAPNENIATTSRGAAVIVGEHKHALLSTDVFHNEGERQYTQHKIQTKQPEKEPGIILELGNPYMINHIAFGLFEKDLRQYSYCVEVSMDNTEYLRVVDYRAYLCRGRQRLYFDKRPAKFIRIYGVSCTNAADFILTSFEAMLTTEPEAFDPETALLIPKNNVATTINGALVSDGVSRNRNALINGDTQGYDWDNGYTCHQIGSGHISVQLPQPVLISTMRLLLWDLDARSYSYRIDVSANNREWRTVVDKTHEACSSWQHLKFDLTPVVCIRIVGTHNTVNEIFHCVHFECPALNPPAESEPAEVLMEA